MTGFYANSKKYGKISVETMVTRSQHLPTISTGETASVRKTFFGGRLSFKNSFSDLLKYLNVVSDVKYRSCRTIKPSLIKPIAF